MVAQVIVDGWPEHKKDCPVPVKTFWLVRLALINGLLIRGIQIVIRFPQRNVAKIWRRLLRRVYINRRNRVNHVLAWTRRAVEISISRLQHVSRTSSPKSSSSIPLDRNTRISVSASSVRSVPFIWKRLFPSGGLYQQIAVCYAPQFTVKRKDNPRTRQDVHDIHI